MTTDLPPSTRPVTLEHVAKVAGVSRATVSRVVNGKSTVDPELRRIVEEAVAATNYVPNSAARSLVTRRTNSVALVVSEAERRGQPLDPFVGRMFTDPHFGRVVSGVIQVLRPQGMAMVLMLADDAESRGQLQGYLRQGHVDGVILVSSHAADPLPQWLTEARIPAVLASRPASSASIAYVDVDQREGVRLAVDHLVGLGRQRIATISGPLDMPASRERLDGFREALAAHGRGDAVHVEGDFTQDGGASAMRALLERAPDLDAVFIASDLMALGALPVLSRSGRRVPEDVAVVGFDDSSAALACDPQLTTVRQPVEDMAAEMARLVLRQIAEPAKTMPMVVFRPTLVVRQSA
ncbi:LacI family DNA-binding transcriptional regulator [Kitasatospora sp. DSM 101779]|uniref:LacI family DNA-binding transcriptional regulator n=1 Tax=Kitasatospora sp. DSM 101779 TaxID=2853165 RepID=UPI0021D930A9|nr:LacI family DNA-binding transcriptional regulator [Kitasatospora sp. DSM 101779]MCU7826069.1 LacI family transcriptional regulator [Kitasatospora sp. DSM 101779]